MLRRFILALAVLNLSVSVCFADWLAVARSQRGTGDLAFHGFSGATRAAAEQGVLAQCHQRPGVQCTVMFAHFEGCYATALYPARAELQALHVLGGTGATLDQAEKAALEYCERLSPYPSPSCSIQFSQCVPQPTSAPAAATAAPNASTAHNSFPSGTNSFEAFIRSLSIWHWIAIVAAVLGLIWLHKNYQGSPAQQRATDSQEQKPLMESLGQLVGAVLSKPPARSNAIGPASPDIQQQPTPGSVHSAASQSNAPSFSSSNPTQGMALRLKRGQRSGALGKIIFTLDARMDVSADNRSLIVKYKLGERIIYDSANRRKYADKTAAHLENSRDGTSLFDSPGRQAWGAAKTFARLGAAAVNATVSALSLRITVNSLMQGVHVECKDMAELLGAENAIVEAGQNLKAEIETATTFTGEEQVIDL
jgi:uncharacterized protein DUF4189